MRRAARVFVSVFHMYVTWFVARHVTTRVTWRIRTWFDEIPSTFVCASCIIQLRALYVDMSSCTWSDSLTGDVTRCMWHDATRDMTRLYVTSLYTWRDFLLGYLWVSFMWTWHDSFVCHVLLTWHDSLTGDVTHCVTWLYRWHNSFVCYMWHDSFVRDISMHVTWLSARVFVSEFHVYMTWFIHVSCTTHMTWLIDKWRDSLYVTRLYVSRTRSYVTSLHMWHDLLLGYLWVSFMCMWRAIHSCVMYYTHDMTHWRVTWLVVRDFTCVRDMWFIRVSCTTHMTWLIDGWRDSLYVTLHVFVTCDSFVCLVI